MSPNDRVQRRRGGLPPNFISSTSFGQPQNFEKTTRPPAVRCNDLLGVGVLSTWSRPGFVALGPAGAVHPPQDDDVVERLGRQKDIQDDPLTDDFPS